MGNLLGKKRKVARRKVTSSPWKNHKNGSHIVSLTSTSLNNMKVEFPKEFEEDLERRKIESFKALAAVSSKTSVVSDAAHEMYEKVRKLDLAAVMVPKPLPEVNQLLSQMNPAINDPLTKKASHLPKPVKSQQLEVLSQQLLETIDMWELMDDLEDSDDASPRISSLHKFKPENSTPNLSFPTIHTIKEIEGSAAKPETVTSILQTRSYDSPKDQNSKISSESIITTAPRKVIRT